MEGEEFYQLMQTYRHTPIQDQLDVAEAFEAIQKWIYNQLQHMQAEVMRTRTDNERLSANNLALTDALGASSVQVNKLNAKLVTAKHASAAYKQSKEYAFEDLKVVTAERDRLAKLLADRQDVEREVLKMCKGASYLDCDVVENVLNHRRDLVDIEDHAWCDSVKHQTSVSITDIYFSGELT